MFIFEQFIDFFINSPTPAFLASADFLMVVSSTPLITLSLTQLSCPSLRSKCWLSSVSLKLWSEELRGQWILVRTDNQNTELAINTGRSRVPFVQSCLRKLWFDASCFDFDLCAPYIPGHQNTIADSTSR